MYQKPIVSKEPPFYQSSMFGIKTAGCVIPLNESVKFRMEVEIKPSTIRDVNSFDELLGKIQEPIYITADLYTEKFRFDDSDDDYEMLQDYDLRNLKK